MLLSFSILVLVASLPFVAVYFGLGLQKESKPRSMAPFIRNIGVLAVIKLFYAAIVLPEVDAYPIQKFIVSWLITPLDAVFFRKCVLSMRIQTPAKGKLVTFLWAAVLTVLSGFVPIIGHSSSYELSLEQVLYAFTLCTSIFTAFTELYYVYTRPQGFRFTSIDFKSAVILIAMGLPYGIGTLDKYWVSYIAKLVTAASIWYSVRTQSQ